MGGRRGEALRDLMARKDYARLRLALGACDPVALARRWPRLRPLEKLVFFKLMDASAAMDFYARLSFREQYFLFCGFPLQSISPILEEADASQRRLFVQLPRAFYESMFRRLLSVPVS